MHEDFCACILAVDDQKADISIPSTVEKSASIYNKTSTGKARSEDEKCM